MSLKSIRPIPPGIKRGKQPLVMDALTRLAKKMGAGAKLPTARELASALGVTGATLTRALERLEGLGILRCRQGSGIYVTDGVMQKWVGLVFGSDIFLPAASPFGALILKHCTRRASERNERFSFYLDTPASNGIINGVEVPVHQDLADAVNDGKLDGIILVARASAEQESWLRSQGIPVVGSDVSTRTERDVYKATFDYQKLIQIGLDRLKKAGCKTVGILGVLKEHREMFQKAVKKAGLASKENWVICPVAADIGVISHEARGREFGETFLKSCGWNPKAKKKADLPNGVLITDDMMARGVFPRFAAAGLEIGKDLLVCSHDNKGSAALNEWKKSIQLVQFDPEHMAISMFDMLEALMKGIPQPSRLVIEPVAEE